MAAVSTIPAAVSTLAGYMTTVANANPGLNAEVYTAGIPVAEVADNYLMVGNAQGELFAEDSFEWAAIPGAAKLRLEKYALIGTIRTWAGDSDPVSRLTDAFTLLNGLHQQILNDIGGSNNLSPSGSWGQMVVRNPTTGPLGGSGWGVVLEFELHVINAQLSG